MSFGSRAISLALLFAMSFSADLPAQTTHSVELQNKPSCSPSASVVSILVRDAAGNPVPGTTVAMTLLRDGKSLGNATEMRKGLGEFALLESDALAWIAAKGDSIRVQASAGTRRVSSVIVVGRDETGCRIAKLSGPDVLTLK